MRDATTRAEWKTDALAELGQWQSGGTPSKSRTDYWDGSIPWASPKDMKVFALDDTHDHISERALFDGARSAPSGTVFVVVRGMILAHTFPVCITERRMAFNQDVKALVPKTGVNGRFIAHWMVGRSDALLRLVTEATHGTKRIDLRDLLAFSIPLPPTPEQGGIAEILDTIDEAIRKTDAIVGKLEQLKQGLLQDLLTRGIDDNGEFRDPDRHPEQFKDSLLGRIPKAWQTDAFGSLCESSAFGPRFSSAHYDARGKLATLRTTDMDGDGNINLDTMPRAAIEPPTFAAHLLQSDDLLISRSGTCGIAAVFPGYEVAVVPGAFLIRFRLKERERSEFLRRYFNSPRGRPRLERLAVGGVQKNLKGSSVLALELPVPPKDEVGRISEVLRGTEAAVEREVLRLNKLRLLKQGMMEDLLTGRVRVTPLLDAEHAAETR